jgi:hypothetical protein
MHNKIIQNFFNDMEASTEINHYGALIIKSSDIETLWKLLDEEFEEIQIKIKCNDGISRTYSSYKEFEKFDNPKSKEIRSIFVNGYDKYMLNAYIDFSSSNRITSSLSIKADEETISRLRDKYTDLIDNSSPWYSKISRIDFEKIFFFIGGVAFALLLIYSQSVSEEGKEKPGFLEILIAFLVVIAAIGIIFFFIPFVLKSIQEKYFPKVSFLIGLGNDRYNHAEKIRWGIIVAFTVSLVAGLLVTMIV